MKKCKGVCVFMENLPLKPVELEVNASNPWCDDKLKRKSCADRLTKILANQPGSVTVSLNGKWGTGKTYLLKRWQYDLLNTGYVAVYYNAWEDDSQSDPLVSILAQLWQDLDCKVNKSEINFDKPIFKAMREALTNLDWKKSLMSCAEDVIAFKWGINFKNLKEIDKTAEGHIFETFLQKSQSKMALQQKLSVFANKIAAITNGKPLIFIVDELDRCRPTFAIETLERIKHLFSIDHVIFVLGIDREQLGHSIQSVYGNIDVENYLHRFIDLDLLMPDPDPLAFFDGLANNEVNSFVEHSLKGNENTKARWREFISNLKDLVSSQHFSLREIEHFFVVMRWLLNINEGIFQNAILSAALVILKIGNPTMYRQYINMSIAPNKVIDYLIPENYQMDPCYAILLACVVYSSYLNENPQRDDPEQKEIALLLAEILNGELQLKRTLSARCIADVSEKKQLGAYKTFLRDNRFLSDLSIQRTINVDTVKKLSQQLEMDFLVQPQPR